jgi:hypothetical protein
MIVYPEWPELSDLAQVTRVAHEFLRNVVIDAFDDGMFEATRVRGAARQVSEINDVWVLREDDHDTVMTFLEAREFGNQPFLYPHPYAGIVLVKYASDRIRVETMVQGNPAWFRLDLKFRGVAA